MEKTVYLRLRRRIVMKPNAAIRLGDIARIVSEPDVEQKLRGLALHQVKPEDGDRLIIDMLHIVRFIREAAPDIAIESYGEPHVLIEIAKDGKVKPRRAALVLAWLLLFFGSGMTIVNFHADVNMPVVQRRVIELLTGHGDRHPWLFQIPYSIGVGLGMMLFFNRLFRKRRSDEPNPLEVEMFMYQENVNHYVITEEFRKKQEQVSESGHD